MTWAVNAPALVSLLEDVPGIGNVYEGDRLIVRQERSRLFFDIPRGGQHELRGARVLRKSIAEGPWTNLRTVATEEYEIRLILTASDDGASETPFQEIVGGTIAAIRDTKRVGSAVTWSAGRGQNADFIELWGEVVHYAVIVVELSINYEIGAATQPVGSEDTGATRDTYGNVGAQIAGYVAGVDGAGKVHFVRPETSGKEALVREFFEIDYPGDTTKKVYRTAKVWRDANEEERGLGQRVVSSPIWNIEYIRAWTDRYPGTLDLYAGESYAEMQNHLDAQRAVFRALGDLGNTLNPSFSVSGPLQVASIDAVQTGGENGANGTFCHHAHATLPVEEVTHAAIA